MDTQLIRALWIGSGTRARGRHLRPAAGGEPTVELSSTRDLEEGVRALEGIPYDVVLLDLASVEGEAIRSLTKIVEAAPITPVIAVSSRVDDELVRLAARAGAQDCVPAAGLRGEALRRVILGAISRHRQRIDLRREAEEARSGEANLRRTIDQIEEELRHARKMEALGNLAEGVAHDFNNLLTSILGHAEMLMSSFDPGDPRSTDLREIHRAGERAAALTRRLLTFGRRQPLSPRVFGLDEAIGNLECMLRRLIGTNIDLRTTLGAANGHVKTDPYQLEMAIMNLVVNARDAMPRGGRLTIETAACDLDEAYARRRSGVRPGPYIMLAVSDTGNGIAPENMKQIFKPFFTTKEKGKGTGLGLSAVYGVVKQSSGNIWVYSEPGRGSTFKIYLPHYKEISEAVRSEEKVRSEGLGSETILLVEDEPTVRRLARKILEAKGYTVLEAQDASDACRLGEQRAGPIHLLLVDVVMPDMNGAEVAERLAPHRPGMRVLYMSGYAGEAIFHHGVLDADKNFLQKPFTVDSLAQRVREVLDAQSTPLAGGSSRSGGSSRAA